MSGDDPFDEIDRLRVARHAALLESYRDQSADTILADVSVLVQLAAYKAHQDRSLLIAQAGVRAGAGHDCREWVREGTCQLCGQAVVAPTKE